MQYPASMEILNKISKIFPGAMLSDVNHPSEDLSINDLIQKIVQRLPLPADIETNSAILNMKDIVDHQELKIQKNMIQVEQESRQELTVHHVEQEVTWGKETTVEHNICYWNPEESDSHIINDKYFDYLA